MSPSTQTNPVEVLFVGASSSLFSTLASLLDNNAFIVKHIGDRLTAIPLSALDSCDIIIVHVLPGDPAGIADLDWVYVNRPYLPVIAIIDEGQDGCGTEAIDKGVQNVLVKNELAPALLRRSIRYSMENMLSKQIKDDSDRLFRIMLEYGQDIITLISAEGTIIYESSNIERLAGFRPEELIGMNLADLIHPDDGDLLTVKLQESLRNSQKPIHMRTKIKDKSGQWRLIDAIGRNFIDDPAAGCIVINSRIIEE